VGAQDAHQGGHARQGRRHHRSILRHRRGTTHTHTHTRRFIH
jgi:hypothetical protein